MNTGMLLTNSIRFQAMKARALESAGHSWLFLSAPLAADYVKPIGDII
jgi:hypothetical protein